MAQRRIEPDMVTYEALLKVVSAGEYPGSTRSTRWYRRVPDGTGEYPESTTSSVVAANRDNPSADDAAWASGDVRGKWALVGAEGLSGIRSQR
jgi:hypothetical protein